MSARKKRIGAKSEGQRREVEGMEKYLFIFFII